MYDGQAVFAGAPSATTADAPPRRGTIAIAGGAPAHRRHHRDAPRRRPRRNPYVTRFAGVRRLEHTNPQTERPVVNELVTPRAEPADEPRAARRGFRVLAVEALGPLTVLGGIVWAFAQPYRVTFFYPEGKGFWDWLVQPPLLVMLVGLALRAPRRAGTRRRPRAPTAGEMLPGLRSPTGCSRPASSSSGSSCSPRRSSGPAVFRRARWRAYLWPSLALLAGAVALADRDLLDVLDAAPARTRDLGAGRDAAGAVQLAVVRGRLTRRTGRSSPPGRSSSPAARSSSTSRTAGCSPARRSSTT